VLYQNILAGRIEFPRHVSKTARDLISKLLQADLSRRLGNLRGGSADIRKHPFFKVRHAWRVFSGARLCTEFPYCRGSTGTFS
jgi:hypothetical protein